MKRSNFPGRKNARRQRALSCPRFKRGDATSETIEELAALHSRIVAVEAAATIRTKKNHSARGRFTRAA